MRVYAIHTGSYSDQGWGPVFSTVEKALAYMAKYASSEDEMSIEVHVLDDEADTGPNYPVWRLLFDKDGNCLWYEAREAEPFEPLLHKPEMRPVPEQCGWFFVREHPEVKGSGLVVEDVYAPDLEHAVKIAADARRVWLSGVGRPLPKGDKGP